MFETESPYTVKAGFKLLVLWSQALKWKLWSLFSLHFQSLFIIKESQDGNSKRAGTWRHERVQRLWRDVQPVPSISISTTQNFDCMGHRCTWVYVGTESPDLSSKHYPFNYLSSPSFGIIITNVTSCQKSFQTRIKWITYKEKKMFKTDTRRGRNQSSTSN